MLLKSFNKIFYNLVFFLNITKFQLYYSAMRNIYIYI